MDDSRELARRLVREGVVDGDWEGALDSGIDPELRARLRAFIERLVATDFDGLTELVAPDVEIIQPPELPGAQTYNGKDGLIEAFVDWPSQWEDPRITPVRVWQTAPGTAIVHTHQVLRGRESGLVLEADFWFVLRWRDGLLRRWTMHTSQEVAERAAAAGKN